MAGFYRLLGDPIHQATAFGGGVLTIIGTKQKIISVMDVLKQAGVF